MFFPDMNIKIRRLDDAFLFEAANEDGNTVRMDVTDAEGGSGRGMGPMQMVATALGGCSGIDIVLILQKARQEIERFDMEVDYERAKGQTPSIFTHLHVHYDLEGRLDPEKVHRAVELSLNKYCSVSKILRQSARVTASFSVNGTRYEAKVA
jgi:putative redox protein